LFSIFSFLFSFLFFSFLFYSSHLHFELFVNSVQIY
jgi:hypothetical protein